MALGIGNLRTASDAELNQLSRALAAKLWPDVYHYVVTPLCEPDCRVCLEFRDAHLCNVQRVRDALEAIRGT